MITSATLARADERVVQRGVDPDEIQVAKRGGDGD
jgi:hypothetical protein